MCGGHIPRMSTVAKNTRSTTINLAVSQAGPFNLDFRLFDLDTLKVYVGGVLRTDYAVSATFVDGYDDAATITFTSAVTAPTTILVDASQVPWRQDDLGSQNLVPRLNIELGRVWSALAELRRDARRALRGFADQEPASGLDAAAVMAAQGYSTTAAASAAAAAASAAAAAAAQNTILKPKGQWLTATAYVLGDLVYQAGSQYECITAHTSGTFATDLSAAKWRTFVAQGNAGVGTGDVLAANNGSEFAANAGTFRNNISAMLRAITGRASLNFATDTTLDSTIYNVGTGNTEIPSGGASGHSFVSSKIDASNYNYLWFGGGRAWLGARVANVNTWVELATQAFVTGLANQVLHVRDEKTSGTSGGTSTTSYTTRTLNTVKTNTISGASVASSQITLPAGTYEIRAFAPCTRGGRNKAKFYNVTDGSDAIIGTSANANSAGDYSEGSHVVGVLTIAGPKVFELRHRAAGAVGSYGFGIAAGFGDVEVYAEALIRKIS